MKWTAVVTSVGFGLAAPAAALAAGGPVPPVQGGIGVGVGGSPFRFVARPAGRDTVVQRVTTRPWRVDARITVPGRYGVPGVDFSGSTTGLAADGGTLVLERVPTSYPVRTTKLLVLNTRPLAVRKTIMLTGWSTVDAISPDGRWLYLIHYRSSNIASYEVLAYDLVRGRLLSKPIVDPRDRGKAMTGFPITRVMSPGGRWAYTLYFRPSGEPFIHALDTAGLRAVCIDLPSSTGDISNARLRLGPGATTLQVTSQGSILAAIDTRTFAVVAPTTPSQLTSPTQLTSHAARPGGADNGPPLELVLAIPALAALAIAAWRLPRPRAT